MLTFGAEKAKNEKKTDSMQLYLAKVDFLNIRNLKLTLFPTGSDEKLIESRYLILFSTLNFSKCRFETIEYNSICALIIFLDEMFGVEVSQTAKKHL